MVEEFVYISDNTYNRNEILRMETGVLHELGFKLTVATPKVFLRRIFRAACHAARADQQVNLLSQVRGTQTRLRRRCSSPTSRSHASRSTFASSRSWTTTS